MGPSREEDSADEEELVWAPAVGSRGWADDSSDDAELLRYLRADIPAFSWPERSFPAPYELSSSYPRTRVFRRDLRGGDGDSDLSLGGELEDYGEC